jgi:hypothetical protein
MRGDGGGEGGKDRGGVGGGGRGRGREKNFDYFDAYERAIVYQMRDCT